MHFRLDSNIFKKQSKTFLKNNQKLLLDKGYLKHAPNFYDSNRKNYKLDSIIFFMRLPPKYQQFLRISAFSGKIPLLAGATNSNELLTEKMW